MSEKTGLYLTQTNSALLDAVDRIPEFLLLSLISCFCTVTLSLVVRAIL